MVYFGISTTRFSRPTIAWQLRRDCGSRPQARSSRSSSFSSASLSEANPSRTTTWQVVQSQLDVLDETALRLKSTLSDVEDLDYAEAVTRMNKEMMSMQAAMSSFSKITGLSLFNYIQS